MSLVVGRMIRVLALAASTAGAITEIIDATGDGISSLSGSWDVAVDDSENVYVVGRDSNNAFRIKPDGTIIEFIDATGDGVNGLAAPWGIAAHGSGDVYILANSSDNAFLIPAAQTPVELLTFVVE